MYQCLLTRVRLCMRAMCFIHRSSDAHRTIKTASDYRVGEVVEGHVRRVETYGVFVELEDSNVVRYTRYNTHIRQYSATTHGSTP